MLLFLGLVLTRCPEAWLEERGRREDTEEEGVVPAWKEGQSSQLPNTLTHGFREERGC